MGDHAIAVRPECFLRPNGSEVSRVGVAQLGLQEADVVAGLHVVAQRLDRPEADIAMAVRLLDGTERWKHEPLGPAAVVGVLLREHGLQKAAHHVVAARGQEPFHRALADVAHTPSRAAILFEPMGGGK